MVGTHNQGQKQPPLTDVIAASLFTRQNAVGVLLVVALFAFELFNYDTTRFALDSLLAGVAFGALAWSEILAIAFCAIDFAGLAHLFTIGRQKTIGSETLFLLGAWLLGATLNALMTWWAVTLQLIAHPLAGNEVVTHAQLLRLVPVFVAVLVWLTRILFIGALSIAGDQLFGAVAPQRGSRHEDANEAIPSGTLARAAGRNMGQRAYQTRENENNSVPGRGHGRSGYDDRYANNMVLMARPRRRE